MKYALILLMILSANVKAQNSYYSSGETDTVKAVMLTTLDSAEYSNCLSIAGYVVRERLIHRWKYDSHPPIQDHLKVVGYLDKNKKPLPDNRIIWDYRLK